VHYVLKAQVKGFADQGMADGDLEQMGHPLLEKAYVLQIEVMARIDAQAMSVRHFSGLDKGGDGLFPLALPIAYGIALRIELHPVGSGQGRTLDHFRIWIHKDGGADPLGLELLDGLP